MRIAAPQVEFADGEAAIVQGDDGDLFFITVSGKVKGGNDRKVERVVFVGQTVCCASRKGGFNDIS